MNGPFGSGHTAQGTGVTLAPAPSSGQAGLAAAFLTPVVATDGQGGAISLAGAGAGGPNGTAAIAYAMLKLAQGEDLTQQGALRSTGIAPFDTVNTIVCHSGNCATLPDPGASGLGAAAGDALGGQ
jgi:gamma-glutamyltranspeptidase / glutathione hydrolase